VKVVRIEATVVMIGHSHYGLKVNSRLVSQSRECEKRVWLRHKAICDHDIKEVKLWIYIYKSL
jgi:hypothetical protein